MRITAEQLQRPIPGGIGTYVRGLAMGLRQLGVDNASLWSARPSYPDPVADIGLPTVASALPVRLMTRAWSHGFGGAKSKGGDVIHASSLAVPPTKRLLTVMIHDTSWRRFPEFYPVHGVAWHEAQLQQAMKRCDAFFTPSLETYQELCASGIGEDRIFMVEEGTDHLAEPDYMGANDFLRRHAIDGSFLLTVGTLEPRKNLKTLLEAYAQATGKNDLPQLLIVGPDGWGEKIKPVKGVVLGGRAPAAILSALYERCYAFVSVPIAEGWGLPAVEAMAGGAAVISSRVPSVGKAALEVNAIHVEGIARALTKVVYDEDVRNELKRKSRLRAAELTWRGVAKAHMNTWLDLYG